MHAVLISLGAGELANYHAPYSSDEFAGSWVLHLSPLEDLAAFHAVFGKSVPDISFNSVVKLG